MVKPDLRKLTRDGGSDPENLGSFGCCGGGECSLLIRKSVAIALIQFKRNCMHAAEEPVFQPCALLAVYQFGAGMISCTLCVITFSAFSDIQ